MGMISKWRQERSNSKLQERIEELEDTVNVRIVDNRLMIVISAYKSIYIPPELFKDDKPESIVKQIREINMKR